MWIGNEEPAHNHLASIIAIGVPCTANFPHAIPDPQVLLNLQPEELGGKILFLLRKRNEQPNRAPQDFIFSNLIDELWPTNYLPNYQPPYPAQMRGEIDLAISEAWAWLIAQALLVPRPGVHGGTDSRVLSRRALKFEGEADFANFAIGRMLPKETLHPAALPTKYESAVMRSEFDVAVLQAMKAVEVSVREAAGLPNGNIGVPLMRTAFNPTTGPPDGPACWKRQKEARANLFAGVIGSVQKPAFSPRRESLRPERSNGNHHGRQSLAADCRCEKTLSSLFVAYNPFSLPGHLRFFTKGAQVQLRIKNRYSLLCGFERLFHPLQ